jgi:NAD(P)-dependent dehydrogenase (short-subunit alcohol dehydrogenase family)
MTTTLPQRFANRVAVVTGAGSGIGRAIALRLLDEGATVVFTDVNEVALQQTLAALPADDLDRSRSFRLDVSEEADHLKLRRWLTKEFGRFDVLVNCAGIAGSGDEVIHCRVQDWDRTMAVDLRGVFLGIKHAALVMIRQPEGGAIVNIASVAALCGAAGGLAYSAAKAGVINLTQTTAVELGPSRVRVNAICPGFILTPILAGGSADEMQRMAPDSQPLPYLGEPEDIAGVAAFLASDDARYITGATIVADGGGMAEGPGYYAGRNPLGNFVKQQLGKDHARHFDVRGA